MGKKYRFILVCLCMNISVLYGQGNKYSMEHLLQLGRHSSVMQIRESDSLINQYQNRLFKVKLLPKVNMSDFNVSVFPSALSDSFIMYSACSGE